MPRFPPMISTVRGAGLASEAAPEDGELVLLAVVILEEQEERGDEEKA